MEIQIIPELITLTQVKQAGHRLFQKKPIRKVVKEMADTARYVWEKGWAERNAGNLSADVTDLVPAQELSRLPSFPFLPLQRPFPALEKRVFLVSITGSRMRDLAEHPEESLCFIYISDNGSAYHIVAVSEDIIATKPTTELLTHLAIHQMLVQKKRPERVILHAHVTELIALSHLPDMKSEEAINRMIMEMHPETKMFVPEGAGFVPYELPGSESLAQATLKAFQAHRAVIWEKHGCIAVAETVTEAFDTMDILAKAAKIWFLIRPASAV